MTDEERKAYKDSFARGGWIGTKTGSGMFPSMVWKTTTTTNPHTTWGTATAPVAAPPVVGPGPELVDLPPRMTRRVLVAFLDEHDEPAWCKKLMPLNVNIDMDEDGTARMTLDLSLVKKFND